MNFFEQELRKLADACGGITDPVFAGRACFGNLGGDNRVKLEFITLGFADKYEALQATVINRVNGPLDSVRFRFADVWGKKEVSNRSFSDGIIPHIWSSDQRSDWYVYKPTGADLKQLAAAVGAYLGVFADKTLAPEKARPTGKESVTQKLREARQTPAVPKDKPGRGKSAPEI